MTFLVLQVFATKGLSMKYYTMDLNQGKMFVIPGRAGQGGSWEEHVEGERSLSEETISISFWTPGGLPYDGGVD